MTFDVRLQVVRTVRPFLIVLTLLLTLAALVLGALAMGSFASLNAAAPPLLRAISAAEQEFPGIGRMVF